MDLKEELLQIINYFYNFWREGKSYRSKRVESGFLWDVLGMRTKFASPILLVHLLCRALCSPSPQRDRGTVESARNELKTGFEGNTKEEI